MVLNRFFINVLIRVIFIILSSVVLGIVLQHLDHGYYYTLTGMIFLIVFQAWMLVDQVNKTNEDLEKFFSSVQDHDSSIRFPESTKSNSFRKLHDRMNNLTTIIQNIKIENERTSQFLQIVVDHVDVGLLSFDMNGRIEIYNREAKRYLNVQPGHLSSLKTMNDEIFKIIDTIKPGQEVLHKMKTDNLLLNILVKTTELKFESNLIKLVSFQDITNELDKKEMDSWQRLIRVLTHEIMNSISPITSLTAVISGYFKKKDDESPVQPEEIDGQIISKTLSGLDTIAETGKGLLDFVDKYRSLTSLPKPNLSKFTIDSLFRRCRILMESNISDNIKIISNVYPDDIAIIADYAQVEQIIINLIKNASEAISDKKDGVIQLKAFSGEEGTTIQVEDNGAGISGDIIEDIFVPFYTTRENGSGIGLSLSKQIMQNHDGTISVNSAPDKGSEFTLRFQ
ncbi:MAG: ATP-binding protein [Bacteroidales bacterium]|jgi:nitrogen fixation/metabolism regulation signal transduction histidine kinase